VQEPILSKEDFFRENERLADSRIDNDIFEPRLEEQENVLAIGDPLPTEQDAHAPAQPRGV
jgi:hypothetical protein